MNTLRYSGTGDTKSGNHPYRADPDLVAAVNMAIVLQRPLLVKGPPGCGKTRLAESIAQELDLPYFEWFVKSTSRAQDGLYTLDTLRRLLDSQMGNADARRVIPYLRFGALGEALRSETESVLLIDEIDKADLDFPNDLLRELDRKEFTVEEIDESQLTADDLANGFRRSYRARVSPIIVITSNDEKELPDAFLRRCLFHYIDFPSPDRLAEIVAINCTTDQVDKPLVAAAVDRLVEIRAIGGFRKEPATSELIDWVNILHHWGIDVSQLEPQLDHADLPFWRSLFKHQQDIQSIARHGSGDSR